VGPSSGVGHLSIQRSLVTKSNPAMLRPAPYLSQKLARPLHTKDGGTLRTVLDARTYMLALSEDREISWSLPWKRVIDCPD
jgi:hypothetical protein